MFKYIEESGGVVMSSIIVKTATVIARSIASGVVKGLWDKEQTFIFLNFICYFIVSASFVQYMIYIKCIRWNKLLFTYNWRKRGSYYESYYSRSYCCTCWYYCFRSCERNLRIGDILSNGAILFLILIDCFVTRVRWLLWILW